MKKAMFLRNHQKGWEIAYFNTLSRDGAGDFDQDGQTDRGEFQSGTDPTNLGSVLSVTLATDLVNSQVTVMWSAQPGRVYDVQYKDSVTADWSTLAAGVMADSPTKSVVDTETPLPVHRFYRVLFD